jgi:hypothetical protein
VSRHVVFGTGQVGSHVVTELVAAGHDVTAVSRADVRCSRRHHSRRRCDRPVVHDQGRRRRRHRVLLPQRRELRPLAEEFPPLQQVSWLGRKPPLLVSSCSTTSTPTGPPHGGESRRDHAGAAVVPQGGDPRRDDRRAPRRPPRRARRGRHRPGVDYFGPGAVHSALGETVFATALTGRTAR